MGTLSHVYHEVVVPARLGVAHSILLLPLLQSCNKWWNGAKNDRKLSGACAVLFDENCCKTAGITGGKTFHVVQRGEEGKLCGLVSRLNPLSSCQGPRIKDDIE